MDYRRVDSKPKTRRAPRRGEFGVAAQHYLGEAADQDSGGAGIYRERLPSAIGGRVDVRTLSQRYTLLARNYSCRSTTRPTSSTLYAVTK